MVIGIDMDDTICSTNELIIVEADKYDKEVLGGTGVKDVKAYEFCDMLGWEKDMKGQFFSDRLEYIMANAEIKPSAKEVINKLHSLDLTFLLPTINALSGCINKNISANIASKRL